jgi:hypothetical protein
MTLCPATGRICRKDYLAGSAREEWVPLRSPEFYKEHDIELELGKHAAALDVSRRPACLDDGEYSDFDALLLALGAVPMRLEIPGADLPHVHYLPRQPRADGGGANFPQGGCHARASSALRFAASLRARGHRGLRHCAGGSSTGAHYGRRNRRSHSEHGGARREVPSRHHCDGNR